MLSSKQIECQCLALPLYARLRSATNLERRRRRLEAKLHKDAYTDRGNGVACTRIVAARKPWEQSDHLDCMHCPDIRSLARRKSAVFTFAATASFLIFLVSNSLAQTEESLSSSFDRIKKHLSDPPNAAEIRFQKLSVSNVGNGNWLTNLNLYYGAYQNGSFFLEVLDPENREGKPLTADGRDKELLWHFRNDEVKKWKATENEANKVDGGNIVRPLVGLAEIEMLTAINLGIPMLVNTSMQWFGLEFKSEQDLSAFKRDVSPEKARVGVSGTFSLSTAGAIIGLRLKREDVERPIQLAYLGYEQASKGIFGSIPRISRQEFRDSKGELQGFIEREVTLLVVPTSVQATVFGPERLSPFVRATFAYTNSSLYKETKAGYEKVVMGNAHLDKSNDRVFVLLFLFGAPSLLLILWFVYHRFAAGKQIKK